MVSDTISWDVKRDVNYHRLDVHFENRPKIRLLAAVQPLGLEHQMRGFAAYKSSLVMWCLGEQAFTSGFDISSISSDTDQKATTIVPKALIQFHINHEINVSFKAVCVFESLKAEIFLLETSSIQLEWPPTLAQHLSTTQSLYCSMKFPRPAGKQIC